MGIFVVLLVVLVFLFKLQLFLWILHFLWEGLKWLGRCFYDEKGGET